MMQKIYWAVTYFFIGYAIVLATIVSLYQVPGSLKTSIGLITSAIVFVDLSYRYFKRTNEFERPITWKAVLQLMTLWTLFSIGLDILLFVITIPYIATGSLNLSFFNQQPVLYWFQFPLFYVFGFAAQLMYNRVTEIKTARLNQLP